ncbi:MAG: hypothetical protein ACLFTW_01695 [Chitinispirillaceae bacterium]
MRKLIAALLSLLVVFFTGIGCGGSSAWKVTESQKPLVSGDGYSIDLPPRWMVYEEQGVTLLTRHGAPMDLIQLKKIPLNSSLPHTTRAIDSLMQVYEVAEVVVGNLRAAPGIYDLTLKELSPAQIDGNEGFLVRFSYALENGMIRNCLFFGFVSGQWYYELGYYALEEFYYENSLDSFMKVVKSFALVENK